MAMDRFKKQIFSLAFLFLLGVATPLFGLVIYRNHILENSFLEYEVVDYYKQQGRTSNFIMEMNYNGGDADISISEDSFEGLDNGLNPLIFYNAEFDDPFTFLHLLLFLKFLGWVILLAGCVGVIFLLIDWRVKSMMWKGLVITSVLCFAQLGYYFISFENKKIETRTLAYSTENETVLFSSFEDDSLVHWKRTLLPATYTYDGLYQTVYYPDLFGGDLLFLADIKVYEGNQSNDSTRLFYGHFAVSNGDQTIDLDSKEIVNILVDVGSLRTELKCTGGFFCLELPVSKSVDIWFNLQGYKTKHLTLFFSDSRDISHAVADCIFISGEGVEMLEGLKVVEKTQRENFQSYTDTSRYILTGDIFRKQDGLRVPHDRVVTIEVYQNGSKLMNTFENNTYSVELNKGQDAVVVLSSEGCKTKRIYLPKVNQSEYNVFKANCVFEEGSGITERILNLDSLARGG